MSAPIEFIWGVDHNGKQVAICSNCHDWFMGYGNEVRTWTFAHSDADCPSPFSRKEGSR